jgi:hypothetical protein
MKNWPIPNLTTGIDVIEGNHDRKDDWYHGEERGSELIIPYNIELPKGWSNPWPELPGIDEPHETEFDFSEINLSLPKNRCATRSYLGYYLSWHIVGISFQNQYRRLPRSGDELKDYNDKLPEENRFGIHICCNAIDNYINKFDTSGFEDEKEIENYLEYCTFLTMIYVIAHEWGHYRSECLSFQINNLISAVTGVKGSNLCPSYLSYFAFKKRYPLSNFEEVFAEWAALKFGVFNYHLKKPAFANRITNWPIVEATVKFMLTNCISNPNRNRPYSDIRHWFDFSGLVDNKILERISQNKKSQNRSVNDSSKISNVKSYKKGRIIDMLMHNQMQFSNARQFNGLIKSAPLSFPFYPDSNFYHFGDDECQKMDEQPGKFSNKFLLLCNPKYSDPLKGRNSRISKIIKQLKGKSNNAILPIPIFDEILPLDPVYFHTS